MIHNVILAKVPALLVNTERQVIPLTNRLVFFDNLIMYCLIRLMNNKLQARLADISTRQARSNHLQ